MGAGDNNGRNYGGGHTGSGDFRKGGKYSDNGLHTRRHPHRNFYKGVKVNYYYKGHHTAAVVSQRPIGKNKYSNQWIPLHFSEDSSKVEYIHLNSLRIRKKCNLDIQYNIGSRVVYTGEKLKKNMTREGIIVDKPDIKQKYGSFVQVTFYDDKNDRVLSYYIHKNLVDLL